MIPDASPTHAGLMSAADKIKLDSLTPGGGGTLAQAYAAGTSAADQTLVIDLINGGAVVFERNDILLNLGYAYTALEILNTTPAGLTATRQNSPVLRLGGQVRVSEPSNISVAVDWLTQVEVTSSGSSPAADLVFSYGIDGSHSERVRFSQTRGFMLLDGTGINVNGANVGDALIFDGNNFVPTPVSGGSGTLASVYGNGTIASQQTFDISASNGGPVRFQVANIGTGNNPGLIVQTGTPGTPLQPQYSPSILMRGSADDSGAVDIDFYMQVATQNGMGGDATGALVISASVGGGPSTPLFAVLQAAVGTVRIGNTPLQVSSANVNQSLIYNGTGFAPGNGGGRYPYTLLPDTDYVATAQNCYLDAQGQTAGRDVTLPLAADAGAGALIVLAVGAYAMSLTAAGSDTIDGSVQKYPADNTVWQLVSNGVDQWRVTSVLTTVP
jgi:hypothetical protein